MEAHRVRRRRWLIWSCLGLVLLLASAVAIFWSDLASTALDPKIPFQTYRPPPAPDYARLSAWRLWPRLRGGPAADVFFIPPTTYDGGRDWNAPLADIRASRQFRQVMAPNYVGPFVSLGRIFAPNYRQASLYSLTTLRDDAREARQFAYGDVRMAFRHYVESGDGGRPLILVGVEQGGTLLLRLLAEEISPDPLLARRLVAAYAIGTVAQADTPPLAPCVLRHQTGCLAAWASVYDNDDEAARRLLERALIWNDRGELTNLGARPALCFNPILGGVTEAPAPARLHRGAANATGLEWGARPAFMARQVSARCRGGVLRVTHPKSAAFRVSGSWADRRKAPGFNFFYADIEADAQERLASFRATRQNSHTEPRNRP